ncbi:MAG: helix-turn-helix transcriptional regulator [Dehalococcoidales bacterium]|nr:helix-turn-helix transcriptional regulator [Dehalococcoidales bacterium]
MRLGEYLRGIRTDLKLTLRDVEKRAKDGNAGADLSSGYLSMLERDEVKEPSPRILYALSGIYGIDYIELMRKAGYLPKKEDVEEHVPQFLAFRGASKLSEKQRERIQRMIDFELNDLKNS